MGALSALETRMDPSVDTWWRGEQSTLWICLSVLGPWVHHASCRTAIGSWPGGERSRYLEASVSEMLWGKGWQELVKGLPKVGGIF